MDDYYRPLVSYSLCVCVLLALIPFLREMFYQPSVEWISLLVPYRTAWMTKFMQLMSVIGDGNVYFYMIGVVYGLGYANDFCYLIVAYGLNFQWSSMLK